MNILVIPEDFRKDQYILKPLIEAICSLHGKPRTRVRICNPPLLQGVTEAMKPSRIREIIDRYPFVHLFLLCVDRDGVIGRRQRLDELEHQFSGPKQLIAANAWEELETWALAGLALPRDWVWRDIRSDVSVKERYFEPLAERLNLDDGPGGGRKALGILSAKSIQVIINKCPEDFGSLSERVGNVLTH